MLCQGHQKLSFNAVFRNNGQTRGAGTKGLKLSKVAYGGDVVVTVVGHSLYG